MDVQCRANQYKNFISSSEYSAQNIHTEGDWDIVFTLLECVGAGAIPPDFEEIIAAIPNQGTTDDVLVIFFFLFLLALLFQQLDLRAP